MALPQNKMSFDPDVVLEPGDITHEVIDQLHSRGEEDAVLHYALARSVTRLPTPAKMLDWSEDSDLMEEIMK
jgi:hypothetical protein